ncbi:uncharacterized protein LOC141823756 [Curcuma longa]|uniref:uncharacterized protein LOC141823756 n=1 Tax=Curcuma longa TaxID=136217 RepID=UPI003D9F94E7
MDGKAVKSLTVVPAKFHKSFWIKRGNFVVVDEGGLEKALESGSKIACIVSQQQEQGVDFLLLAYTKKNMIRRPAAFEATMPEEHAEQPRSRCEEETDSDGEVDGLPLICIFVSVFLSKI